MLEVRDLHTGYGRKQAVFGVSLTVSRGEIVAVIGPNGSGKSTLLKAVVGLLPAWTGEVLLDGCGIACLAPHDRVSRGIGYSPQGNRVLGTLSVLDNLRAAGTYLPQRELDRRIAQSLELFPALSGDLRVIAGRLSGGERQMLALARAMVPNPGLLLLDEPSAGLSPAAAAAALEAVAGLAASHGVSVLIVEQKVREVLPLCHRVYSLKLGRVAFSGEPQALLADKERLRQLFL